MSATWWWLSFADGDRPEGEQFLGVSLVQADDFMEACIASHAYRCNPGGEVRGVEVSDDLPVPPEFQHRLLNRNNITALEALWDPIVAARGEA